MPKGEGPFPGFLYIHGGFFCVWSPEHLRKVAMRVAEQGLVVVNLEYGLAPEHPFPWAVEDTVYAARWITQNIERYGGDGSRIGIGGDSCGANLSAATIVALTSDEELVDGADLAGVPVEFAARALQLRTFQPPADDGAPRLAARPDRGNGQPRLPRADVPSAAPEPARQPGVRAAS